MDLPIALASVEALLRTSTWLVSSGRAHFYTSVLTGTAEARRYRFDPGCMRPVSRLAKKADLQIADALNPAFADRIEWEQGLVLLLDNWRVAHGREAVE